MIFVMDLLCVMLLILNRNNKFDTALFIASVILSYVTNAWAPIR